VDPPTVAWNPLISHILLVVLAGACLLFLGAAVFVAVVGGC
jgi:hypothetical protein